MKVVILAGGLGTRLSEETEDKPKPMVRVGNNPILWHIMNIYAVQGFNDFIIAGGYKSEVIGEWIEKLDTQWKIKLIDTGLSTQTGGRIKRCISEFSDNNFMLTYGDGLANVNLKSLVDFFVEQKSLGVITAVNPPTRFGALKIRDGKVFYFGEKPNDENTWINGGFFVLNRKIASFIEDDNDLFETGALPKLAEMGELSAFKHHGFWKPMDTLREKRELDQFAQQAIPPWLANII